MQQICRRIAMPKCDFNKVANQSVSNLLHIFRTPFLKNTSHSDFSMFSEGREIDLWHKIKFVKIGYDFESQMQLWFFGITLTLSVWKTFFFSETVKVLLYHQWITPFENCIAFFHIPGSPAVFVLTVEKQIKPRTHFHSFLLS